MPGFDGTGPLGQGARSGRGLGKCQDSNNASFQRGMGRGRGFCAYNTNTNLDSQNEAGFLKGKIKVLKEELAAIEKRLGELE